MAFNKLFLIIFLAFCAFLSLYIPIKTDKSSEYELAQDLFNFSTEPLPESELEFISPYLFQWESFDTEHLKVSRYNITACQIRKSMSQMTVNTMLFLSEPERFIRGNHTFTETWNWNESVSDKGASEDLIGFPDVYKNSSQFTRFVFIRDPFERFISFYLDKCIHEKECYECEREDMRCFAQRMYESFLQASKGQKKMNSEFNQFHYLDIHATPFSWCCDFLHYRKVYHILVIGSDLEDRKKPFSQFADILRSKNVPEKYISTIMKNVLKAETSHSTHKSNLRAEAVEKVQTDPVIREYLHKTFFYDYLVFPELDRSHLDPQYREINGKWDEKYKNDYENIIEIQDLLAKFKN